MEELAMFKETMEIFGRGYYPVATHLVYVKLSTPERKKAVVLYPEDVESICQATDFDHMPVGKKCEITCENMSSYSMALQRLKKSPNLHRKSAGVLVLNFANPVNPGGGVRRGARAQEEDLCRESSLLLSLESREASEYYDYNRSLNTYMGSDAIIISPRVEIIRDENGELLEDTKIVSVLTCAAPMITNGIEGMSRQQYEDMFYRRIEGILKCAVYLGYRNLVLGAFGCGAFGNDAHLVSDLFCKAIREFDFDGMKADDMFLSIDFAVRSRSATQYNFREFSRNFGNWTAAGTDDDKKNKYVLFWKTNEENGYLSNWHDSPFVIDDFIYGHVEQYIMAQKARMFHDAAMFTEILRTDSPEHCKKCGRKVSPFDSEIWDKNRYSILLTGVYAKFSQNPKLKEKLLATGDSVIAEASPKDAVFGIGIDADTAGHMDVSQWPGKNLLGKALMEVRAMLR